MSKTAVGDLIDNMILVLGAARSGTTWLGKIFDSHPDVLYRHEPDTIEREVSPDAVQSHDFACQEAAVRDYLRQVVAVRSLKSAGQFPVFPKSYLSRPAHLAQLALISALRGAERVRPLASIMHSVPVPDFIGWAAAGPPRLVMKSVSSCRCAGLYAQALPNSRIVYILRDPWGQVASMMRGVTLGKLDARNSLHGIWEWEDAARHGLTRSVFEQLPLIEQFAWFWAVANETAIADLAGCRNAHIVTYSDLCDDPIRITREIFGAVGLDWSAQTEAFIARSTHASGDAGYFRVVQNTAAVSRRWRTELPQEDQRRILAVLERTRFASYLPALSEALQPA